MKRLCGAWTGGATKKASNAEWVNPHDPEAEITRMKDGRTALAYKAEHAVDMDSGAIVTVTAHGGAVGDTSSVGETLRCQQRGKRSRKRSRSQLRMASSR